MTGRATSGKCSSSGRSASTGAPGCTTPSASTTSVPSTPTGPSPPGPRAPRRALGARSRPGSSQDPPGGRPRLELIAEDLGDLDQEALHFVRTCGIPGMKVMGFAFDPQGESAYLPHNCQPFSVVYTGTHDTPTFVQFLNEAQPEEASYARRYLRLREEEGLGWGVISGAWASGSYLAIAPLQDVLGLGADARMNTPRHHGGPQLELAGPQRGSQSLRLRQASGDHPYLPPVPLTPYSKQKPALCGHIGRAGQVYSIYHHLIILFVMILPVYCSKYPPGPGPSRPPAPL